MLGTTGKRILLTVHLVLNAVWIGGLVVILLLMSAESTSGEGLAAIDRMVFLIHDTVVMNVGFGIILTGLLFSSFTKWGFFDFPWVILKWAGLLVMFVIITFVLAPAVNGMAALSDLDGLGVLANLDYAGYRSQALWAVLILLGMFLLIVVLSVFKPWGPRKTPFKVRRKVVVTAGIAFGLIAIGGGVMQYLMLQSFRSVEVRAVDVSGIADGEYAGEARLGALYRVMVFVRGGRIEGGSVLEGSTNHYARLGGGIMKRIVRQQTPAVRAITGATTSSKGLMKAVENALVKGTQRSPAGENRAP